jgi:hypothetical protein
MSGIPREVIEHHLKIYPDARPVQQRSRKQSIEQQNFIREEIKKLFDAGFIREVHHPQWLVNPMVVPKANGKLQMCINYTSLNKACSKDTFPLPRIDQIIDSTSGCDLLCFLDAYSDFHQIPMSREDEENTAFIIVYGLFCYVPMPYAVKNGAQVPPISQRWSAKWWYGGIEMEHPARAASRRFKNRAHNCLDPRDLRYVASVDSGIVVMIASGPVTSAVQ